MLRGGVWLFTHSARFGALPQGEHLERLTRSPRYVDGEFRNELPTPILTEEKNMTGWSLLIPDIVGTKTAAALWALTTGKADRPQQDSWG